MKTIVFSTPAGAVKAARQFFAVHPDPEDDFLRATGDETVGGVFFEGTRGDLILHRSEKAVWMGTRTEGEAQAFILTGAWPSKPAMPEPDYGPSGPESWEVIRHMFGNRRGTVVAGDISIVRRLRGGRVASKSGATFCVGGASGDVLPADVPAGIAEEFALARARTMGCM